MECKLLCMMLIAQQKFEVSYMEYGIDHCHCFCIKQKLLIVNLILILNCGCRKIVKFYLNMNDTFLFFEKVISVDLLKSSQTFTFTCHFVHSIIDFRC